ncbi:hypothetical protein [Modicisalibacter coralii]|uniref:hypothetical protein n=1 Tax=Modicisalibacter coralii TaxID=2304602 RepID=UPI00100A9401|nr:hypothetical protein [Halomonas coralii]
MAERALPWRCDAQAAMARLRRLGAERFEAARLAMWAFTVALPGADPVWLLCHRRLERGLLWPASLATLADDDADERLVLAAEAPPDRQRVARLWFWERLARRGLWRARLSEASPLAVSLPLWLGYAGERRGRRQLLVISGVSGEPLAALKPAVLAGLREDAQRA